MKIMIHPIESDELIKIRDTVPVADVRTPAEFEKGHIPGASNLPLFSNEQRVLVGTTYKQESREAAILLGFDLAGPKWSGFIRQSLEMAPQKKIAVHCWRGGMRSGAMAWALDLYGFEVFLVKGGYKSYRKWVLRQFEENHPLYVLGGLTGSGKTKMLHQLRLLGEQVIDLEDIAQHQGSSYGTLNKLIQPSQEQFENNFAEQLNHWDHNREIWVEDESLNIGRCSIPRSFWHRMQQSPLIELQVAADQRVGALVKEYGSLDKDFLVECTDRIRKRLGFEQTKQAITAIREDRMDDFIRLVLFYYDKTYRTALKHRSEDRVFPVPVDNTDPASAAGLVLDFARGLTLNK
ncbi:MAG TPA: tRNA 2-selenouridine(34) synthase MnmH [Puia sp.]|jgi:tRNA 2-selenouridine synthase